VVLLEAINEHQRIIESQTEKISEIENQLIQNQKLSEEIRILNEKYDKLLKMLTIK